MSIYPVTSTRLKTFVLLGHSNADGWAGSSPMITVENMMTTVAGIPADKPADALAYWKNIYVFTSEKPFPGAGGTPTATDIGDGEWLEMTISNPLTPGDPHPHASPFNYPNVKGSCCPNWYYDSDLIGSGGGTTVGAEVPFAIFWRNYWQDQVGCVKVAQSSTLFMPADSGFGTGFLDPGDGFFPAFSVPTPAYRVNTEVYDSYAWWTPADCFDFAPSTMRYYGKWYDKMVGAAAALPDGCKMDVRLVIPWFGDNDASADIDTIETSWKNSVRGFIKRIRKDIADNDWSSLPAAEIVIVWPKVNVLYGVESGTRQNEILEELERDDPYLKLIEVQDLATLTDDGYPSTLVVAANTHYGHTGYIEAARRIMDAFQETQDDTFSALDPDQCITVGQVKSRVKAYYGRSRTTTDLEDDDLLLQHINGAFFHILNHAGDNAWWLERRAEITLSDDPPTLPRFVYRLTRIEAPGNPSYPLQFEQIGFTDQGRITLSLKERGLGTYDMWFITRPRDMKSDGQLVPMPQDYIEWLVVECCRRLARSSGNAALQASFEGESMRLQMDALRSMGNQLRSRRDTLKTQRRRVNLGYRNSHYGPIWGRDFYT